MKFQYTTSYKDNFLWTGVNRSNPYLFVSWKFNLHVTSNIVTKMNVVSGWKYKIYVWQRIKPLALQTEQYFMIGLVMEEDKSG